jgi:hypothetical protein
MKVAANTKMIERNSKIGKYTTIASLVILGLGLYISFNNTLVSWSFVCLLVGFLLSQIGIYYTNRWGRSPRPDEVISSSLKGLEEKYTVYHYSSAIPHLLVGPAGVWALIPFSQKGTITYDEKKNRWKQAGANWYMKMFAQESLGRPDQEIKTYVADAQKAIDRMLPEGKTLEVKPVLVFTNESVKIDASNAPVDTLKADKLKDFFRQKAKEKPVDMELIRTIQQNLPPGD